MQSINHAVELFNEMIEVIKKLIDKPQRKVLLSCTSGLTTTYFAQQLNDAANILNLEYSFEATPYADLYDKGRDYDIILLAPQIAYLQPKVQEVLRNKMVLQIPASMYAKYDTGETLSFIQEEEKNHEGIDMPEIKPLLLKREIHNQKNLLVISMIREYHNVKVGYRIYYKNEMIHENEVCKPNINLHDIGDIVGTVKAGYDIDCIGISIPGIVENGKSTSPTDDLNDTDVAGYIEENCGIQTFLFNDTNAAAMGYYATQNEYSSLSLLFQPTPGSLGGIGSIFNGQLIEGHHHIAGESKFLPNCLSDEQVHLSKTPEGSICAASEVLRSVIGILDPELIVVKSDLICNSQDLYKELSKAIPEKYLPEIVIIEDLNSYSLLGTMILCVQELLEKD
ncbi:MAG: ROK family protein [Erysipelotrichaceae bacterium]|nr:ROK family protein [Erysipelotrichaceae bacterium]